MHHPSIWNVVDDRGQRTYMEDRYTAAAYKWNVGNTGDVGNVLRHASVFGVFDGHNGASVAQYCQGNMANHIVNNMRTMVTDLDSVAPCLRQSFQEVDDGAAATIEVRSHEVGSTACVAVVTSQCVWVANAGDSRAFLMPDSGTLVPMSEDHKPSSPKEMQRITRGGGVVSYADGIARISGLSVSRGIGDRNRRPHVICTPDVRRWSRTEGAYLIIASDGVWDELNNSEVAGIMHGTSVVQGLHTVVARARRRGSSDNITVMHIRL